MKHTRAVFAATATIFALALIGCPPEPKPAPHVHQWGEWVVTTPATFTEAGEETRTCVLDATHKETRPIPMLSIADLGAWLTSQPANTATTPYIVKLNVSDLGGDSYTAGSVGNALYPNNYTRYVSLDLSGSTINSIGNRAFRNCYSLVGVTIPNSVTSIELYAFESCSSLTSITIPDGVISIEDYAFSYCTSLASISIGSGVTSIGVSPFSRCTSLTTINVDSANSAYISADGVLYNKDKTNLLQYPAKKTDSIFTIPNSVTRILDYAFYGTGITSVTIPDSVTGIGNWAFGACTGLTVITIPGNVGWIGGSVFTGCTNLTAINVDSTNSGYSSADGVWYNKDKTLLIQYPQGITSNTFTIPNSVTMIGGGAFEGCTNLASITIPDSVTQMVGGVFEGCTNLTSVNIPNSVTGIGYMAFRGCTNLLSVTIGNGVTNIEHYAFQNCTSLASVTFQGTISSDNFSSYEVFSGDLRSKFYATNAANGTPGTYTTTAPVSDSSVWTKQ